MLEGLSWIEHAPPFAALRTSTTLYPLLSGAHIVGIAMLFGCVLALDLSILRAEDRGPAAPEMSRTVIWSGFFLAVFTGGALFGVRAVHYAHSPAFLFKLCLLAAAGMNLLLYRSAAGGGLKRTCAAASICIWSGTIFAGRWIGFSP